MSPVWLASGSVATALLVLLVWTMQRRGYFALYPVLFLYILVSLLASIAEWAIVLKFYSLSNEDYKFYYWTNEFVLQTFLFILMLAFVFRALEKLPHRLLWTIGVGLLVLAAVFGSILASGMSEPRKWLSLLSRNLSFASALLNFLLWTALIKNRGRDLQLLLLAAGVGLMATGKAIGQSLRTIGPEAVTVGNVIIVGSQLLCLGIWLWALRAIPARDRTGKLVSITSTRGANA